MTQPVAVSNPAIAEKPAPHVYKTTKEIAEAIVERIPNVTGEDGEEPEYDLMELPHGDSFTWFTTTGAVVTFNRGRVNPLFAGLEVFALFQDDAVARVYSLPIAYKTKDEKGVEVDGRGVLPTRHTLTKISPTFFTERMGFETFIAEVADEWQAVYENSAIAADEDDDEAAPEATPGKGETIPAPTV